MAAGLVVRTISVAASLVHEEIAATAASEERTRAHEFRARAPPRAG
jgi:hypothetical protein